MKLYVSWVTAFGLFMIGAGCTKTESVSSNMNGSPIVAENCQVLDYGIQELNLVSSYPILSGAYDLNIKLDQLGDCPAGELTVSIYEDDTLVTQHRVLNPKPSESLAIGWAPRHDGKIKLGITLELLDDNTDNNQESISVTVNPLGNYLRINELTADTLGGSAMRAESFVLSIPIRLSGLDLYLQKSASGSESIPLLVQLREDENGVPGKIIKQIEQETLLYDQFEWCAIPMEQPLNAGKYWVSVAPKDSDSALWHYGRKPAGGSRNLSNQAEYEANQSTMVFIGGEWKVLPEKDYSIKVHAGGTYE